MSKFASRISEPSQFSLLIDAPVGDFFSQVRGKDLFDQCFKCFGEMLEGFEC